MTDDDRARASSLLLQILRRGSKLPGPSAVSAENGDIVNGRLNLPVYSQAPQGPATALGQSRTIIEKRSWQCKPCMVSKMRNGKFDGRNVYLALLCSTFENVPFLDKPQSNQVTRVWHWPVKVHSYNDPPLHQSPHYSNYSN